MLLPMATDSYLSPRPAGAPVTLVVGTMNFGKRTTADESARIIARALERGLSVFDTANVYNDGESERIVGRALRSQPEARIASKCGIGKMTAREGLSAARVAAALDESLQRLGRDHVDLYYLHAPDPKTPIEETLEALQRARAAGKIRAFGVSNYASWQICDMVHLCKARSFEPPRVSQVLYNLLIQQLDLEYFAFAKRFGIHTTVYNPLAGGVLAGKGKAGARFEKNPMYQRRYLSDRLAELAEGYAALATQAGLNPVQLAYAWIAERPGVDSVLLGPASVEQLDAGIDGCALQLSTEVRKQIDELHRQYLGTDVSYAR